MKLLRNRKLVALLATLVLGTTAVAGYAYWTASGAGTGAATNASSNGSLVLHASFADNLTPGASEPVSYTADNLNSSSLQVGTVHAVVSIDAAHASLGCLASDFTVADMIESQTIAAGASGVSLAHDGTIAFADTAANQDGCKGALVTLTLSS
jgi:hypothetical protein